MRDKAREQAAENALTLFLMATGFVITWIIILIIGAVAMAHGN